MMPAEIMYNLWKDKKLNTKILQWLEKEVMLEPDTFLKTYFDKDSVTQVYDSVEIKAGRDGFIHLSKQKSEGKDAEDATHQENVASHEIYLPCQCDDILSARFRAFLHETQGKGKVQYYVTPPYVPTFFGYLISVALRANFELSNPIALEIQQKYIYRFITYL